MTMKKPFLLFFFLLLVVLSCTSCKEECNDPTNPDCPNYVPPIDPCAGSQEVSADFTIEMKVNKPGYPETWIESNVNILGSHRLVRLHANLDNAISYKWLLGADTLYSQDYEFVFGQAFSGQTIPVTLIIMAEPNNICFPNDNGMDTITKYIEVKDICTADIFGRYWGSWASAPSDSFEIAITSRSCDENPPLLDDLFLVNFDQTNDSCGFNNFEFPETDNFYVKFNTGNNACSAARGTAILSQDRYHFQATYQLFDPANPNNPELWPMRQFRGRKLD